MEDKIRVIAVVGPTASGKTRLGVTLALALGGEVVSADSMQIYKGMDIASAKPTKEEMRGIAHHMIDFLPNSESFSVADYVTAARGIISDINSRGKLPIIVGGTGLYVDSLLNNINFSDTAPAPQMREELRKQVEEFGAAALWERLNAADPEAAAAIEPNNVKRVIRAIEICETSGMTMTEQKRVSRLSPTPYAALKIGLKTHDRSVLYDRINRRVDEMVKAGLVEEARDFLSGADLGNTAKMAIGCKELAPFFRGEQELSDSLEVLKRSTRRYAKRQLTWFMRDENIHWFNIDENDFESIERECIALAKAR